MTRLGHEYRDASGLRVCHLCGAERGTPDAERACDGSAAEPDSIEDAEC